MLRSAATARCAALCWQLVTGSVCIAAQKGRQVKNKEGGFLAKKSHSGRT